MIRVRGVNLTRRDRRFLKQAAEFTMDYLLPVNNRVHVNVDVGPRTDVDHEGCGGLCTYHGKSKFDVWIHQTKINQRAKTQLGRYNIVLSYLFHELVHVKQYASGELVHIGDKYKYRGKLYKHPKEDDDDAYFEAPDEIEAYGREIHLVRRFVKHWKKLTKDGHTRQR